MCKKLVVKTNVNIKKDYNVLMIQFIMTIMLLNLDMRLENIKCR